MYTYNYTIHSIPTVFSVAYIDDNDMKQQTSPLPPDAEQISQQLADIWWEVLYEDDGTKEITCNSSIPNVMFDPSAVDIYSEQPSTLSLEEPSSFENLLNII